MKRILCALLACAVCATAVVGLSGCGCSDKSQEPGYKVTATEPDLKSDEFGFFILNKSDIMITTYLGSSKDVKIPDSFGNYKVKVIGHSVFNGKDIQSVEIPNSIEEIQDYAFASNRNLKSVTFPEGVKIIGTNAFFNCTSLESVSLPTTLKRIGVYAFSATGLKSVKIPESKTLSKLDEFVFYQCKELSSVELPSTITNIADNTFNECSQDLKLSVNKGSYALNYAKQKKLNYQLAN